MPRETLEQKKTRVKKIIAILKKAYPDARLALEFSSPLELLVALILAAQARDEKVNLVTRDLFKRYRTARDYAAADFATLSKDVSKINFYRNKTGFIQAACKALAGQYGGKVPPELDKLLELPGVGRKTANIILGNAFNQPAIGVDTHVKRLAQRLGLSGQADPDKIEEELVPLVPKADSVRFCHLLQAHGRQICQAKKPLCYACPVAEQCFYPDKTPAPV